LCNIAAVRKSAPAKHDEQRSGLFMQIMQQVACLTVLLPAAKKRNKGACASGVRIIFSERSLPSAEEMTA